MIVDPKGTGWVPQEIDFDEDDKVKKKQKKEVRYRANISKRGNRGLVK